MKLQVTLSHGNTKLQETDEVCFAIWNLPAVITCPYRTALCEKHCYAKKAECGFRPNVLPARLARLEATKDPRFEEAMEAEIFKNIKRARKQGKKLFVRIHESGDFYSREYYEKWVRIANYFSSFEDVTFSAYTKSIHFVDEAPANINLIYSVWEDSPIADIAKAARLGVGFFTATASAEKWQALPEENKCHCLDCGACGKCYDKPVGTLVVKIH